MSADKILSLKRLHRYYDLLEQDGQSSESLAWAIWICETFMASDYDISPCMTCGEPIVCVPDGMPMCPACAEKEASK